MGSIAKPEGSFCIKNSQTDLKASVRRLSRRG